MHDNSKDYLATTQRVLTRRGVVWLGQTCNLRCVFCYFRERIKMKDHPDHPFMSLEKAKSICSTLRKVYYNNAVDIQGGEPTLFTDIIPLLEHCRDICLKPTLITNALELDGRELCRSLKHAGLRDLLISVHGLGSDYDRLSGVVGAHDRQMVALENLKACSIPFRFNCVLAKPVLQHLENIARLAIDSGARVLNFIAFNPFEDQQTKRRSNGIVPTYREISGPLVAALDILNECGIEANVRYFPLCMVPENYRKHLYNFQQLPYDLHEWDFASWSWSGESSQRRRDGHLQETITLRQANYRSLRYQKQGGYLQDPTISRVDEYRHSAIIRAQEHCGYQYGSVCGRCSLKRICDGFHGDYVSLFSAEEAVPVEQDTTVDDPIHYIRHQTKIVEMDDANWVKVP